MLFQLIKLYGIIKPQWIHTPYCFHDRHISQSIASDWPRNMGSTVYPKKYAHGFVVLCFVVVLQSFIMNSHEVFIHIHQGCFAGNGAIVRLPQCQWSKPDGYGKTSQCRTTTKHSKAQTVCIFLGIYCMLRRKCLTPWLIEAETKWRPFFRWHFQTLFFLMKMSEFRLILIFNWISFLRVQILTSQHWCK